MASLVLSERRQHRPEWYFRTVLVSWRLWALGAYTTGWRNWRVLHLAFGPLRFQFVRPTTRAERTTFDNREAA